MYYKIISDNTNKLAQFIHTAKELQKIIKVQTQSTSQQLIEIAKGLAMFNTSYLHHLNADPQEKLMELIVLSKTLIDEYPKVVAKVLEETELVDLFMEYFDNKLETNCVFKLRTTITENLSDAYIISKIRALLVNKTSHTFHLGKIDLTLTNQMETILEEFKKRNISYDQVFVSKPGTILEYERKEISTLFGEPWLRKQTYALLGKLTTPYDDQNLGTYPTNKNFKEKLCTSSLIKALEELRSFDPVTFDKTFYLFLSELSIRYDSISRSNLFVTGTILVTFKSRIDLYYLANITQNVQLLTDVLKELDDETDIATLNQIFIEYRSFYYIPEQTQINHTQSRPLKDLIN